MSLTEVEENIREMSATERRRISALLIALEDEADPAQREWVNTRTGNGDSNRWIPVEDALKQLDFRRRQ